MSRARGAQSEFDRSIRGRPAHPRRVLEAAARAGLDPRQCAICGVDRGSRKLDLDHDAETGRLRGYLCRSHNVGLGHFQHNPDLLRRAADYLEAQTT